MTTALITYLTCEVLPCACNYPADVIFCVTPSKLAANESGDYEYSTMQATLVNVTKACSTTSKIIKYEFSYDDAQIAAGKTLLATDILGVFCKGCIGKYIEDQLGPTVCVVDSTSIDFELNVDNCVTGSIILSEAAGNILEIAEDGLFAADPTGSAWGLLGNAGTVDGTNFLGTTDDVPFTIRANDVDTYRIVPAVLNTDAPNLYSGLLSSFTLADEGTVIGSIISGGKNQQINKAYYGGVLAGEANELAGAIGTYTFGMDTFNAGYDLIVGGYNNVIDLTASFWSWTFQGSNYIGAGYGNLISQTDYSSLMGGLFNAINYAFYPDVSVTGYIWADSILGGYSNLIFASTFNNTFTAPLELGGSVIGGGSINNIGDAISSGILGGEHNYITRDRNNTNDLNGAWLANSLSGGVYNQILEGHRNFLGGGGGNLIEKNDCSGILSGFLNKIDRPSLTSTGVPGLQLNLGTTIFPDPHQQTASAVTYDVANAVLGGIANRIIDGYCSSILGGAFLQIGKYSVGYQSPSTRTFTGINAGNRDYSSFNFWEAAQIDISAFSDLAYFGDVDVWVANTNGTAKKLKLIEPNSDLDFSSANYTSLEAQAQTTNIEYKMPATLPTPGQVLTASGVAGNVVTLSWA